MRIFVHHALRDASAGTSPIDAETAIGPLRIDRTDDDIATMVRAIAISDTALAEAPDLIAIDDTEIHVEARTLGVLFAHGADGLAFPPIVGAGDDFATSDVHAEYRIAACELLLGFGAAWGGFRTDITHTVFVEESISAASDVYDTATGPAVTGHDIDGAVTHVPEDSFFADRIRTTTGHDLGRAVHDAPYTMRGNRERVNPVRVFSRASGRCELDAFGVRIENAILVISIGSRSLTTFPKTLTVVGC